MSYKPVTHVIFDLDGTLLDTEHVYEKVIGGICEKYGKKYSKDVRMKVLGTTEVDCAKICVNELSLPIIPEVFLKEYQGQLSEALRNLPLLPGAEKLVNHLYKCRVPLAIATSSGRGFVDIKMAHLPQLSKNFHHLVCATTDPEVKNGKPNPDIFEICAKRFQDKPRPETCLVFEDAPNGVKAAIAAGMQVVHIPDPDIDHNLCTDATLVLDSLEQFKPELFGLPTYSL